MTALEAFNALNNREVSRKEVEQVLTQAKTENNTAIIYRLSQALNNSPEATHFEITITQYDSSAGLSGVQHIGDYREALDDCGRLRKGWKFVNGNVVKVEEKPKKEAKPKKEKAPQKEIKKDKKYKFVVITDDRHSRVIAVFSYTNPNIEELSERFWKNSEGKYYETTEEGLRNYAFGMGPYPFAEAKKHIEEKYTEGKDFIYFNIKKDGGRDKAISLVEKPKKEAKPKKEKAPKKEETTKEVSDPKVKDFEAFDDLQAQLLAENADIPESEVLDFLYNFTDAFEEGKTVFRFWNTPGKKPTEAVLQYKKHPLLTRLQNPSAKMRAYELTPRGYELLEKFHKGVERIKKTYDLGYIAGIHKLYNFLRDRKAYVKKEEAEGKENSDTLTKFREQAKEFHQKENASKSIKFSDIDNNRTLIESFTDKNTGTSRLFVKDSLGLTFSFYPLEKFMAVEQISALYGKDRKEEAEKDFLRMKEEIAWAFNHHVRTAQREGTLEVCERYFLEKLPEFLAKGGLWLEAKAKNKGAAAAKSSLTKLRKQVWEEIGALAVGEPIGNVQNLSKKKDKEAPTKATKSLKSRKEKGENVANFILLQEPTKVFLEFEDEKNETYYKKSADKQGAVGSDFLKKILKDLKKQNLKEEPRGFINTEDFLVKPTISKITGIESLKTIVAKDNLRPALECVLIEANRYVATDLYNIILLNRSKNDGLKTGALYDPNYKCTKIGGCSKQEYYRDIERGYLNYKAVLTENPVYTSDWVAIEPIIQHLKSGLEVIRKIYDWKKVYVVKITSNVGEGHYNLKYLLNDLQILQSNGAKKIRLYTNKLDEKLNIETDNGNIVVTMAVYMGDRSNYEDVISQLRIAPIQLHFTQNRKEEKGLSGVDYSQGLFGDIGLKAPRHEGILKEALNECGRLKKGWKFEKGKAVKVETKAKKEKVSKKSSKKIKIIPPYVGEIEYNEEGDNYIALEKELGDIMGAKFDQWQKEIIAHNREKKLEMYSKEIWKKIDTEKDTKEDAYVGDYEPDEKGFYYKIRQEGKKKYRLELSVHRSGRFSAYPTVIEDFKSLKECGDFLIKTLDKSNGFYYTNMLGLSQLQNKINELKGYQYSKQIHFEDEDEGLTGTVPEVSTERFKKMSVPELREYTLEYYLENYGGKSISKNFFKEDNIQIEFFNTAGKKLQKPIYKEKVAVLEHLESLIKNSTYNNWGNRKESSPPNIIGYLNFKAKVTIDGEKRHVRISIAVDGKRKFRFKTLEVGANPKKKKQATSIPAPWVTESLRDSSLSEDKGTKKSLSRKEKDENFGLKATEAPVTSLTVPRQTLAQQLAKSPEVRESFLVADEQMSLFLGALEKKTKDSLVITLTGKQGSGKTRFAFQFMNALAQRYRVGHASIEEHPESVLYEEKAYQYLNDTALEHITAQDVRSLAELDTMIRTNEVIVIDSFQKMRELAPHFEIDKDLRKKYDGKLFLVIFQQTADGKMRGGSKSQFDGDIILFTETFPDYRENYVYPDKNRYNKRPATELQYSIYEQRMLATAPEVPALPAHYEPTESEELNFEVL